MSTQQFLASAWTWNIAALVFSGVALTAYLWAFNINRRILYLLAGLAVFVLTLVSPLNALAAGYLFSAHMLQHILLLLIVPALLLMSLPRSVSLWPRSWLIANPFVGWIAGVGAMWLWHARPLCNAAVSSQLVNALQICSLLLLGAIFWRQILAPRDEERLSPPGAVLYMAADQTRRNTACRVYMFRCPAPGSGTYTRSPSTTRAPRSQRPRCASSRLSILLSEASATLSLSERSARHRSRYRISGS